MAGENLHNIQLLMLAIYHKPELQQLYFHDTQFLYENPSILLAGNPFAI